MKALATILRRGLEGRTLKATFLFYLCVLPPLMAIVTVLSLLLGQERAIELASVVVIFFMAGVYAIAYGIQQ